MGEPATTPARKFHYAKGHTLTVRVRKQSCTETNTKDYEAFVAKYQDVTFTDANYTVLVSRGPSNPSYNIKIRDIVDYTLHCDVVECSCKKAMVEREKHYIDRRRRLQNVQRRRTLMDRLHRGNVPVRN